jgi:hypothetical protein
MMILFGGGLKQQNNDIACIEKENECRVKQFRALILFY